MSDSGVPEERPPEAAVPDPVEVAVLELTALERGPVAVELDGVEAVAWRAVDGAIGVVARACPHLDWDLSEGRVDGRALVCPAHGWAVDPSGRVFKRNERGREDEKGRTRHWCATGRDGKMWVRSGSDT